MLEQGYIKLYRSLLRWEWYDDANTFRVFVHLLLTVNHEPQKWHGITIDRGQRLASFSKIAQELSLSIKEVRTAIRHLIETGELAHSTTAKYGIFTIQNYEKFQGGAQSEALNRAPEGQAEGTLGASKGQQRKTQQVIFSRWF
mgnify:FL=1